MTLIVMTGVPGSGKTTVAKHLAKSFGLYYICPDDIRAEMSDGNANDQTHNKDVFEKAYSMLDTCQKNNMNTIWDATNLNAVSRGYILEKCNKNTHIISIYTESSKNLSLCKFRNNLRAVKEFKMGAKYPRHVPENVIDRMYKKFEVPMKSEGWDMIIKVREDTGKLEIEYWR